MDIRIHGPEADVAERAAVDSVLDGQSRPSRDLLLPALHAVQDQFGWLKPGALNYICSRMDLPPAEVFGVATFYHLFSLTPAPVRVVHVCDDIACRIKGAESICAEMEKKGVAWKRSPCLGQCDRAPATLTIGEKPMGDNRTYEGRLLQRVGRVDPAAVPEYRALRRALEIGPEAVIREVNASNLVGRGGAAFPTGRKWDAVAKAPARPHYVVCNADESEPGTFKDRVLMEGDPFAIVEGMTIAAFATGARKGYIYIRGEYPAAAARISSAIGAARAAGLLGEKILDANFAFDIELRRGAGAYICGEETALFNSIEGFRGEPRNKPPFPTQAGLFRQPTVINNVETLASIPEIILRGGAAYARVGTAQSSGYRLFCVSGNILRPGVYEVPLGVTLRSLLELAGGVSGSGRLQSVLLGGAAGTFLSPHELDLALSFEAARAAGATLGSGAVVVFDDSIDMRQVLARIARFFQEETCGQCVPCRVGTMRQAEILERLASRKPLQSADQELHLLKEVAQAMRDASICGLGQTASSAILSAISRWSLYP